jgi:hypothetical protein
MPDNKNVLQDFDWDLMLSFSAKNLKLQKNAEMLNNMVVKLSRLDAGIKEAVRLRDDLLSDNDGLRVVNSELLQEKDDRTVYLAAINSNILEKQARVEGLDKLIRTNIDKRRLKLESEFNAFEQALNNDRISRDKDHEQHCESLCDEIKKKQGQLDVIDAKRKEMASKLNESV